MAVKGLFGFGESEKLEEGEMILTSLCTDSYDDFMVDHSPR